MNVETIITISSAVVACTIALLVALQKFGVIGPSVPASNGSKHNDARGNGNGSPYRSLPPTAHVAAPAAAPVSPTGNTGRYELDGSLGAMRCDRHQALEDAIAAAHVEAREFRAEVKAELRHLREDVANVHAVTSELRDAALRAEVEPRRYPVGVVRGGAAVPR